MPHPVKLLLLYGGKSGEHEISLISAASVLAHLNPEHYQIIPVAIDKNGLFHLHQYNDLQKFKDKLPVTSPQSIHLDSLVSKGKFFTEIDVVFPVIHGPLYEDGCLQGLLQLANVAYVGCGVLASALGMDKDIARRLACVDGLSSAGYKVLPWQLSKQEKEQFCVETISELGLPLFVKPCSLGSSVGIHKVHNAQELAEAIEDSLRYDESILVEEAIKGREIEVAVLENPNSAQQPFVSVAGEIAVHHKDGFYSYSAKYLESGSTELIIPANLNETLLLGLQQAAVEVFKRLKCRGMARIDFFVDEEKNKIYFNEINTIPGFTPISMYPALWQASGKSYTKLLDELIERALSYQNARQYLVTDYL